MPPSVVAAPRAGWRDAVHAAWALVCAWSPLAQDALLYGASCVFALLTAAVAVAADYRVWGLMAGISYGAAALASAVGVLLERRGVLATARPGVILRRGLLAAVMLGAVVAPLFSEVAWRAEATPGAHAQPEVAVIERAGDRVAAKHSPYLAYPHEVGISPNSDGRSVDASTFFPYLPGMVVFGLANAYSGSRELGDARLYLAGFTLIVAAAALAAGGGTLRRRTRVAQVLIVLPFGALPMVTGGDDLPVLALALLGLVFAARERPIAAGVALGVAATLKVTAWPILILLGLGVLVRSGRRAALRFAAAAGLVSLPVILLAALFSPTGFLENVVRFPLGLSKVNSPAASPLLGQVLTSLFPGDRRLITAALAIVGALAVVALIVRRPPRTAARVAGIAAFTLALATVLSPATRFGYLIYPANLAVWAVLLGGAVSLEAQSASSRWNSVSERLLAPAGVSPLSAGVSEGLAVVTTTPTSQ